MAQSSLLYERAMRSAKRGVTGGVVSTTDLGGSAKAPQAPSGIMSPKAVAFGLGDSLSKSTNEGLGKSSSGPLGASARPSLTSATVDYVSAPVPARSTAAPASPALADSFVESSPIRTDAMLSASGVSAGADFSSPPPPKADPAATETPGADPDEECEDSAVAPGADDTPPEGLKSPSKGGPPGRLDVSDRASFLLRPPPPVGMIECTVTRIKSGIGPMATFTYLLRLQSNDMLLLAARKRKGKQTANYLVSLDRDDMARTSPNFVGKLRGNFLGTEFTVFNNGECTEKIDKLTKGRTADEVAQKASQLRRELGYILYERNVLGTKGPRKMTIVLPQVSGTGEETVWQPKSDAEGIAERFKKGDVSDVFMLRNNTPTWNQSTRAFTLNFRGRVTKASVKNFQLVDPDDRKSEILLQFGKIDEDRFTLDFRHPISGLQAFCIALSSLDSKIACE